MPRLSRWAFRAFLCGWTAVSVPAFALAGDEPAAPAVAVDAAGDITAVAPEDVSDRVEVKLTGAVRPAKGQVLISGVTVRNTSDEELLGRLVVVVDETGHEDVTFAPNDGALETGKNYVEVLSLAGKLKSGAKTTAKRIEFIAGAALVAADRQELAPKFRVLRITTEPTHDDLNTPLAAEQNLPGKNYTQSRLNQVMDIQNRHTAELLKIDGVFGTATGEDDAGNPVVLVYTQRHGIGNSLPDQVEGVDVQPTVTGAAFRAGPAWKKGNQAPAVGNLLGNTGIPTNPTARFTRPVPIGVSLFDLDDGACAAGTLGCRIVFPDGTLGILTNCHVGAQEAVPAAQKENLPAGIVGDVWTQPGCLDFGVDNVNDMIATLTDFQPFNLGINYIDAAVGRISSPNDGLVMACTPEDGYGFPSRDPVAPMIGMRVLKYGRTTGLRKGKIRGLNANVTVAYTTDDYFFVNQIDIYGDDIPFGMPGDSGSLIVTEQGHHPVGLLYAGGGFQVLANPIHTVIDRFNIAIDDGSGQPPAAGPRRTPGSNQSGRMGGAGGRVIIP